MGISGMEVDYGRSVVRGIGPEAPTYHDSVNKRTKVEEMIYTAFASVELENGMSWAEAERLDLYASPEELIALRQTNTHRKWQELVDDTDWRWDPGVGGFGFLDALGYRFYIAPAMLRVLRGEEAWCSGLGCRMEGRKEHIRDQFMALDAFQGRAIAEFVRLQKEIEEESGDSWPEWKEAWEYWREIRAADMAQQFLK